MGRSKVVAWFCSVEKVFCDIFQNSKGNTFAGVSFLIKVHTRPVTLLKKRLLHRCFPLNFEKSHRAPFYKHRTTASGRWHILNNYWKLKKYIIKKFILLYLIILVGISESYETFEPFKFLTYFWYQILLPFWKNLLFGNQSCFVKKGVQACNFITKRLQQ